MENNVLISGISCKACGYFVFASKEEAFFEICPICNWQNDGKTGDQYSSCNHSTVNDYKKTDFFQNKIAQLVLNNGN